MADYSRASVELEGGDLVYIHEVQMTEKNGAKVEHTFRKQGSGVSFGPVECSAKFKVKVPTQAAERNWRGFVRNKKKVQLTLKYPNGERDVLDGAFDSRDFTSGLEGAAEMDMSFVGTAAPVA